MARTIKIDKVMNGFLVECGCQRLVFEQVGMMLAELGRYLQHPDEVEKEYTAKYGLAGGDMPRVAVQSGERAIPTPLTR